MERRALRTIVALGVVGALGLLFGPQAGAYPMAADPPVQVSGASLLAGCLGDQASSGTNYVDTEVEPWVAVNPAIPPPNTNVIGAWQQDRWRNGGSRGIVTASSIDGGTNWVMNADTHSSICTNGVGHGGNYERSSDPWVTFSPNGDAYLMTLSVDTNPGGFGLHPNAMLVMKSTDGGASWSDAITLKRDEDSNVLNDKNTMTADPFDSSHVYAVWDRIVAPPAEQASGVAGENDVIGGYHGPTWFARTTDGGQNWEPARIIYNPGTLNQTLANMIVVTGGSHDLVNSFDLIYGRKNSHKVRGFNIAVIRSEDQGDTWSNATIVDKQDGFQGMVRDPDPTSGEVRVRTGDVVPISAADPTNDNVYIVWQDRRFTGVSGIAFSMSTDGGQTWSPTSQVNQTPTNIPLGSQQAFTPVVRVLPDHTVAVFYYDFRNNTSDPSTLPTDAFVVHCHPDTEDCTDKANWEEDQLTATSFDMRQAPVARGFFVGDYEGLDQDGTDFGAFYSMPHSGDQASVFWSRVAP